MKKKVNKQIIQLKEKKEAESIVNPSVLSVNLKPHILIICIIGFVFYFNSFFNQYALDDDIVISKNEFVMQGIKGIPAILTTYTYYSFYKQMNASNQLYGRRYRPLSLVSYALETQFFGNKASVRHVFNVLFYILTVVLIYYFLAKYLFPQKIIIAFISSMLFLIHPIHTEVVANIKSRDEIFSLLFMILTFIYAFKYRDNKKTATLLLGVFFYFLSLISKEYGIILIVLLPLSFYLVKKDNLLKSILAFVPYIPALILYFILSFSIAGIKTVSSDDIYNNPFLYATPIEQMATKLFILLKYFSLLLFPYPLSADYSYNQIFYRNFGDIEVWASLFLYIIIGIISLYWLIKRNILSFASAFFLLPLALVSNFFVNYGASMGERLMYQSSLGFVIILGYGISKLTEKINYKIILIPLVIITAYITIQRNADWKDGNVLFIKDVNTVPNSTVANCNAGTGYLQLSELPENKDKKQEYLKIAINYLEKAVTIHPGHGSAHINLGLCYFKIDSLEKARVHWDKAKSIYSRHYLYPELYRSLSNAYMNKGIVIGKNGNLNQAISYLETACQIDSLNPEAWYNKGGCYFTMQQYLNAKYCWEKTLRLNPNHPDAKRGYDAIKNIQ